MLWQADNMDPLTAGNRRIGTPAMARLGRCRLNRFLYMLLIQELQHLTTQVMIGRVFC